MSSTVPDPARHSPKLLVNGTIHSTAEPYAEAMIVEEGQVSWLGSDETAEQMRREGLEVHDLDRALVSPGFVGMVGLTLGQLSPGTVAEVLDVAAHQLGYSGLRLRVDLTMENINTHETTETAQHLTETLRVAAGHPVDVWPVLHLHGVEADGGAPSISPVNDLLDLMESLDLVGRAPAVQLTIGEVLPNLLGVRSWCAEAGRQLLLECSAAAPSVVVEAVVTTQKHLRELKQGPSPAAPTVLVGFDTDERSHWEDLLNTGVHVLLTGPGHLATALSVGIPASAAPAEGQNPWKLVADHVYHPQDPVSVRAGFNAQTRGAFRSLPDSPPLAGQLNPGTDATYAVWEVEQLSVQTPGSTVSAWSTDTRARTPLLPYLDGETLPRLVSTVIRGR
jgi:hypothetical protein